ncbi:MAG TPA: metallophosphoesterase [Candidatus Latescibacteria bacterium]|nr:metallophosphoesterase [Candidatus Latescibacterota bacterium]
MMSTTRRFVLLCAVLALAASSVFAAPPGLRGPLPPQLPVPSSDKFTFAIIGDRWGGEVAAWPVFDRSVEEINLTRPDFVMSVGDLIDGKVTVPAKQDSMWRDFWLHAGKFTAPFFVALGNHDLSNPTMLAHWKQSYGPTYYSFDYSGCHFVILCTEEMVGSTAPGSQYLGPEQTAWALHDLAASAGARHTFLLMHKPIWRMGPNGTSDPEIARIEQALGGRPATFFAGHTHTLELRRRGDRRYFVVGPTATRLNDPADAAPESGSYNHYTTVTVEGSDAHVAIRRPGNVYREDIAEPEIMERLISSVRTEAEPPRGLDGPQASTAMSLQITNPFERDTLFARISIDGLSSSGWQSPQAGGGELAIAPGRTERTRFTFTVPTNRLVPLPELYVEIFHAGRRLGGLARPISVFTESMTRRVDEWTVIAPFSLGGTPLDSVSAGLLANDPQAAMPGFFRLRGPEGVWNPRATYRDGATQIRPRTVKTDSGTTRLDLGQAFGRRPNTMAYAVCGIRAPKACTVYALLGANDHADILVNGAPATPNRVVSLTRGDEYLALPLKAGWNTVVVRTANQGANWWFDFTLFDPTESVHVAPVPGRN